MSSDNDNKKSKKNIDNSPLAVERKRIKRILPLTVLWTVISIAIISALFDFQLYRYEEGILSVYASQQDAYVQLVLDQINLNADRYDDEIIDEILSSLDASTNKYWTFSREGSILFVKDVLETNKYKGITTETYYSDDSAKIFLDSLVLNKVTHKNIKIQDKNYIASGVAFEYNYAEYKLCLLTNKDVLLDNNKYLGSKVLICTVAGLLLVFSFLIVTWSVRKYQGISLKILDLKQDRKELQKSIEILNDKLIDKNSNITRNKLWNEDIFPEFINKIKERKEVPVSFVYIACDDYDSREQFLVASELMLDEAVLRFAYGERNVILLGINMDIEDIMWGAKPSFNKGCHVINSLQVSSVHLDADLVIQQLKGNM